MSDDYFALLHLDLECNDPARIRAAVAETRARCSQGTMSGFNKMACEQLLSRLPEIEAALLDPTARRQARDQARQLRAAARETRLAAFREDLAMLLAGGRQSLTEPEREHLLRAHSDPAGPTAAELVALIGVPVLMAAQRTPAPAQPLPAHEAKEIARNLALVDKADLYQLLGLRQDATSAQITARRDELALVWSRKAKASAEKSAVQALLGRVATVLLDPGKRASYAATLREARLAPLLGAVELALADGRISAHEHAHILARAKSLGIGAAEAEAAILAAAAAAGAPVELAPAPVPKAAAPRAAGSSAAPTSSSAKLIATFNGTTGWAGKTITWKDKRFTLEDHGPISAAAVLSYDRRGYLSWAHEGLREWAQKLAKGSGRASKGAGAARDGAAAKSVTHSWAVGWGGAILATRDGGASWWLQRPSTSQITGLNAVDFADAKRGWAVGDSGAILATTDGGDHWASKRWRSRAQLRGVTFATARRGWAVGENGTVLATKDGGATWHEQLSRHGLYLTALAFPDPVNGWAVGSDDSGKGNYLATDRGRGVVFATTDGGATWHEQLSHRDLRLWGVACGGAGLVWAAGIGGIIIATTDYGAAWTKQRSGTTEPLWDIAFIDASHGWAVGTGGTILATKDGGGAWLKQRSGSSENLNAVSFSNATHGWAVGNGGTILATDDGGATWRKQSSGTNEDLEGVVVRNCPR